MTERQAWAALAKGVEGGGICGGLCDAIVWHEEFEALPDSVRIRMRARINRLPNLPCSEFKWPLDKDGQRARAAYCRRQVARLTPKRKPAPKRKAKR